MSAIRYLICAAIVGATLALGACGFALRRDAPLPEALTTVHIESVAPDGALTRGLIDALARQGARLVPSGEGAATLAIRLDAITQEALTISRAARVQEFLLRYRVTLAATRADGSVLLPESTVELTRDFVFDQNQALGGQTEADLLRRELERDMLREVLARIGRAG